MSKREMNTKTFEAYQHYQDQSQSLYELIVGVAKDEFTAGTRVQWRRGTKLTKGIVVKVDDYHIVIKTASGAVHRIDFDRVEFDTN
jgi:biotin-(acetyl-CoA carboxylase) ligase